MAAAASLCSVLCSTVENTVYQSIDDFFLFYSGLVGCFCFILPLCVSFWFFTDNQVMSTFVNT